MRLPILMYHHVVEDLLDPPPKHPGSYVTRKEFARQLDSLLERGYQTLTLADALGRSQTGDAPARGIVLTFDDGCRCFAQQAVPELEQRGMTATVFVVSDRIGGANDWDLAVGERPEDLMDAAELRAVEGAGFEIGSHSATHRDLANCDREAMELEVSGSRQRLAEVLAQPPRTFCYPYGHFDAAVRGAVEKAGYLGAVSVFGVAGVSKSDRFALPRVGVEPGESGWSFRLKASRVYPGLRRLPRLGLLGWLRSIRR